MKILVIGTGMYVSGRNTDSYGTIFPSIIEFQRANRLKNLEILFVGKNILLMCQIGKKLVFQAG